MPVNTTIKVPPLESGDRLTRPEFERHYQAMPLKKLTILIEGVVYVASSVRIASHGRPNEDYRQQNIRIL